MRPSALLHSLSIRFPARLSSSPVVPLPVRSSFDQQLTAQLDTLRPPNEFQQTESYTSARWLLRALDVTVATQKMMMESLADIVASSDGDGRRIESYLEDIVELLDACNCLCERMETVQKYTESLRVVLHCLEGRHEPSATVLQRARVGLDSCEAMEKRCADLEKCSSGLRKLGEKLAQGAAFGTCGTKVSTCDGTELQEVLHGSRAVALLVCGVLRIALSFKSKCGLPVMQSRQTTSWSSSLHELHKEVKEEIEKQRKSGGVVLTELRQAVTSARNLRDLMNSRRPESKTRQSDLRMNVVALERSCGELEECIKPLEGRVNELYKHLISIRMTLLGFVSQA